MSYISEHFFEKRSLRLVLVLLQNNQKNEPVAGLVANAGVHRLAFTKSALEA